MHNEFTGFEREHVVLVKEIKNLQHMSFAHKINMKNECVSDTLFRI
jgi:hypothetical protein